MHIPFISGAFINGATSYPELVKALQDAFSENNIHVPLRHHHEIVERPSGTMLLMPAWSNKTSMGVKLVNVFPDNKDLPTINGLYIHFNRATGQPLCIIDAKALTNKRTAAASALASQYLSRKDSHKLLMIGTGALAPDLIKAHSSVRPINEIYVWGRNTQKADVLCKKLHEEGYNCKPVTNKDEYIPHVDIISSATMAKSPLINGKLIMDGTHIDLVGSYKPDMREADNEVIRKSKVFVDIIEGATKESGDIVIPIKEEIITVEDIKSDLYGLCSNNTQGRVSDVDITLFKSVGYALEDLVGGDYYYYKYLQ